VVRHRDRGRLRAARAGAGRRHAPAEDSLSAVPNRRPGRRPGNPATRDAVLTAARTAFAERGFDGATIRAIATAAGVDPALVHHYFGSKDQLFLAAIEAPADPADLLPEVLAAGRDELGAAVVRLMLTIWDGPMRPAGLALVRSAVASEWTSKLLREFLMTQVLRKVVSTLGFDPDVRAARASLVASQLVGLVMARYVLRLEPVASASPEWLVATVGPTVQRYLTGEIPLP
jgi:AcrR family transcriptional regulator